MGQMHYEAWFFETDITLEQMLSILNRTSPWQWKWGDNDSFGIYLRVLYPYKGSSKFKIIKEKKNYILELIYDPQDEINLSWDEVKSLFFEKILPAFNARNLKTDSGYE